MPIFDLYTKIVALSINEKCKTQFEIFAYKAFFIEVKKEDPFFSLYYRNNDSE